jgi:hypothetical protein
MLFSPVYAKPQHGSPISPLPVSILRNLCSLCDSALACPSSQLVSRMVLWDVSDTHFAHRVELSPLECAVADEHRVLRGFSRSRQASSPLDATLTSIPVTVDSKQLTGKLSPLESALTQNTGEGAHSSSHMSFSLPRDVQTFGPANVQTIRSSHCSARTLVPQLAKAREIFAIRGNKSALPGV